MHSSIIERALDEARSNVIMDGEGYFARELAFLVKLGFKIDAIKKFRAASGHGLKESKDFVELFAEEIKNYPISSPGHDFQRIFNQGANAHRDAMLRRAQKDVLDLQREIIRVREQRDDLYAEVDRLRLLVPAEAI